VHPLSSTCDHLGIIGGTLEDVWRTASQISLGIGSPGHPFLSGAAAAPPAPRKPKKLIRLYTRGWTELDTDTVEAFEQAIEALAAAGVKIVSRNDDAAVAAFEEELEGGVDGALAVVAYEMRWPFEDYIARFGRMIGERIHGLIERAGKMTPAAYEALLADRCRVRALAREVAAGADGFVTLASSGPAIQGLDYTGSRTFLVYGSWLGLPAFSLPLMQVNGLPLGMQLLGVDGSDGALCSTANWMMNGVQGVQ
jgi:Asp-tRNA(Asn)/Glu-tRNA(Gln) amidotransferase A subunit family amidase